MDDSRHAANPAHATPARTVILAIIVGAAAALTAALAALVTTSFVMARRVVTPANRAPDARIVDLDTEAQTVTLERTEDTVLPGRYGLFTEGTESYVKIGSVLAVGDRTVKRKLLTHISKDARLSPLVAFSGWYFERPEELHVPFTPELIDTPVGPCPAWLFPAGEAEMITDTWVIIVHGRGTTRAEGLRAVAVFHGLGITSLVVSYRNDGEAPRSRGGTYKLGATEWLDVDAALAFARERGANRVLLMGWSMGGAIVMQVALNSAHADMIDGIILESPVIDWRLVLGYQAKLVKLPKPVTDLAMEALQSEWGPARVGGPIPLDSLDIVARADELRHPMLILHSDDDGFVPSDASHELVSSRPDLVELHSFDVARHTKLWNYDQERWSNAIRTWVQRHRVGGLPVNDGPEVADS